MSTVVESDLLAPQDSSAATRETRKIRVLRLFSRLNIGGPAIHVILATAGLDPHRYDSRLVVGREGQREGNFFDYAHAKGVPFRVIPSFVRRINPLLDIWTLIKLYRLMKRERPDIVHTHTAKAGALGRVAARLARVPIVVHTFHGSVFKGYFDGASSRVFQLIEKALVSLSDKVVAVSPRVAEELEQRGIAPREKVEVVYLGLELDRYQNVEKHRGELRRELGISPEVPLIGSVGRLVPIKDIPTLLRAMKSVGASHPDASLLVIGDGPERPALELEAYRIGVSSRVRFLGFRRDLERVYADIDVAVNCSQNEGTPVALIEAMAAGVPVLATSVGGTPDLFLNGLLGRLVPSADSSRLSEAICDVLRDPVTAQKTAAKAQDHVFERFRSERLVADLDRLYTRLLSTKLPKRRHQSPSPFPPITRAHLPGRRARSLSRQIKSIP
jgi:glycosyltransferase involved in cell wall biosynthesis